MIARQPVALQLRYLQNLDGIGVEKNNTLVFPLPVNLINAIMSLKKQA